MFKHHYYKIKCQVTKTKITGEVTVVDEWFLFFLAMTGSWRARGPWWRRSHSHTRSSTTLPPPFLVSPLPTHARPRDTENCTFILQVTNWTWFLYVQLNRNEIDIVIAFLQVLVWIFIKHQINIHTKIPGL